MLPVSNVDQGRKNSSAEQRFGNHQLFSELLADRKIPVILDTKAEYATF